MQAANTGLTEGSTPSGNDYDREIVIISTLRLDKLHVIGKGEQVLARLEQRSIRWKKRSNLLVVNRIQ